ncbi:MAG: Bifunctional protein GlmU [Candidatus Heimdallarchaeota archaeon LC_3]|nr:MAG: Bifunctional protein GlmU [Candidatus Heimdallarchaeota archaeon LC_3]
MISSLALFTNPESLKPLDSFVSNIAIAGINLFELAINSSRTLKSENLTIYRINANEKINIDNKKSESVTIKQINKLNELNEFIRTSNSDLIVFLGETVFSSDLLNNIRELIEKNRNSFQIFGSLESSGKAVFNSISYFSYEKKDNSRIRINKGLNNHPSDPRISLIYFPSVFIKDFLPQLIKILYTHNKEQFISIPKKVVFHEIDFFQLVSIDFPWHFINANELLMPKMSSLTAGEVEQGVTINGNLVVESGARILSGVYINGPVYISKGAVIGPNCFLRGNTYIGEHVKIGQSVEIKNSIILKDTHIGHLSYIGDSIIGPKNNFGAGSKTANLAFHNKTIKMSILNKQIDSKRRKLGIITGMNVKTGINSSLMPGIKLYDKSIVGAHVLVQNDLPEQIIFAFDKKNELIKKKHNFY